METEKTLPVGFLGGGNMAGAIIGGLVGQNAYGTGDIGVCDISQEKREQWSAKGHPVYEDPARLTAACRIVVLAIKPQMFAGVMPAVKSEMTPDKILVSIAAGISAEWIKDGVGFDCKVVLAMPNTPLLLGCGATALSRVEPTTLEEFRQVQGLFSCAGIAEEIPAGRMNQVITVNGSSPAYLYLFAQTLVEYAAQSGIPKDVALRLVSQTMKGAGEMLEKSGMEPRQLIDMVCSPGGTTLAAMDTLETHGFVDSLRSACGACTKRAEELSK